MIRLHVVVEGRSEERFAHAVLRDHLAERGTFLSVMPIPLGGGGRGGGSRWARWQRVLTRLLKEQRGDDVRVTTWLDLYAIPSDTPGWTAPRANPGAQRADAMLAAMAAAIGDRRFLPYIQVHELEALLFARLDALERVAVAQGAGTAFARLAAGVRGLAPEQIDDGPETAPSKRILSAWPAFRKTTDGVGTLVHVGLPAIRAACPRFDAWITTLEALGESPQS